MNTKTWKINNILAIAGLFSAIIFMSFMPVLANESLPFTVAADKVVLTAKLAPGFYQFNSVEIFKSPTVDEPPATIEVIQKNEKSCAVYGNGKSDQLVPCVFEGGKNNYYIVQIDERTTLLGASQEPALLSDFAAGEKINVLGWLLTDGKTIRAAVVRNLEAKNFHQSLSGTVKKVTTEGFILSLQSGDEIFVSTPIVEGAQITVKGVFDKINNSVNNVLSLIIRPNIILESPNEQKPAEPAAPSPSPKSSTLFKNFLKVFGL